MDIDASENDSNAKRRPSLKAKLRLKTNQDELHEEISHEASTLLLLKQIEKQIDFQYPSPLRMNPIPKGQEKDPINYISNTSRLNPENSSIFNRTASPGIASPSLSPVMPPSSPVWSKKRRLSSDDPAVFPINKRHRLQNSPQARPTSPNHHLFYIPRKRSGSVSSVCSSNDDGKNRGIGQLLNLSGTQGGFGKLSLSADTDDSEKSIDEK